MPTRPLTPEDLATVGIARRMRGYDRRQIDRLLHEVAARHAALAQERDELRERLDAMERELAEYRSLKGRVSDTLLRAERMADDMKAEASRNSEQIVAAARERAEEELDRARKEAAGAVAAVRDESAVLQREIDRLQTVKAEMHAGYRAFLLSALELLDEHDEPPVGARKRREPVDESRSR